MKTLIALACFALTAATAGAQVTGGRQLYESRCARCHGGDATGGESGPGIVSQIDARADADLADFLRAGRPAAGMPALDAMPRPRRDEGARDLPADPGPDLAHRSARRRPQDGADDRRARRSKAACSTKACPISSCAPTISASTCCARPPGDRYRVVTSQRDWTTYHGDPGGNRYTTLTQIDKSNVARLAPRWVFPIPNVTAGRERRRLWSTASCTSRARTKSRRSMPAAAARSGTTSARAPRGWPATPPAGSIAAWRIAGDRLFMLTDNAHMIAHQPLHRRAAVGHRDGGLARELQRHVRAAGGRQSGHLRHRRRRRRRARIRRRLRHGHRQGSRGASGRCPSRASRARKRGKGKHTEHRGGAAG